MESILTMKQTMPIHKNLIVSSSRRMIKQTFEEVALASPLLSNVSFNSSTYVFNRDAGGKVSESPKACMK